MRRERDLTFTILSAVGIILILLGHLDFSVATFGGLFPYYSYHVLIFVFIAGYFYKPEDEDHIGSYILRKAKRLLLPYYLWNIVYGLISMLLRQEGFSYAGELNLYNILVAPLVGGHQFGLNAAAWFVPVLFILEVCDILARRVIRIIYAKTAGSEKEMYGTYIEWVMMVLYLLVGIVTVWLSKRGSVYDLYRIPARLMFMAPTLQFGRLYRSRLYKYDITPSIIYFPLIGLMNLILTATHGGLAYSTVWVNGFSGTVITPFITTLTGIALWLRISKILSRFFAGNKAKDQTREQEFHIVTDDEKTEKESVTLRAIKNVGEHTFDIMMHHLAAFMLVKAVFYLIFAYTGLCSDFDINLLKTDLYYTYIPDGVEGFKWLYLAAGLLIPLLIAGISDMAGKIHVKKEESTEQTL